MSDDLVGAPGELQPNYPISFDPLRGSLSRSMAQPLIVDDPVGLVIFGDSSAIYLAHVVESGSGAYERLRSIKAKTYIHGWAVDTGRLYVLDGVELSAWNLIDGQKKESISLLEDEDATSANAALVNLQKAIQRVEWATLLEQSEDDWVRLTAEQSAAPPDSADRDRLEALSADFIRMLRALREAAGATGAGSVGARTLIAELRKELADKRKAAAAWLFSSPLVRRHSFEEPMHAIFMIQGDGTLHSCDKALSDSNSSRPRNQAELQLALLEETTSRWLGYISNSTLYVINPNTLAEASHWSPTPAPAAGTRHSLTAANGHFWWTTETGVYALKPNASGVVQPAWKTGAPWTTKQIGRHPIPSTPYNPPVNPNDLFDTMNVRAWIAKRGNPSEPLTEGMMAQLLLSDQNGKYTSPPEGKSYISVLPFARGSAVQWTDVKPHPRSPLVLLSDSSGLSMQCRYPSSLGGQQLVPHWATAPWVFSTVAGSPSDRALSTVWPTPSVRPLAKPYQDMIAQLYAGNPDVKAISDLVGIVPDGKLTDRHLRYIFWFAALGFDTLYVEIPWRMGRYDSKPSEFPRWCAQRFGIGAIFNRFGLYGRDFRIAEQNEAKHSFRSTSVPVNFDPPWTWPAGPPMDLFHSPPPAWYDPWGYNRPGDFISTQPAHAPSYIDPFCFDGQLRFPQRSVTLESNFKGQIWSVFTDNDPASILASAPPPDKNAVADDPVFRQSSAEPATLVVMADEKTQRTTFQLLPPRPLRITYDANQHTIQHEAQQLGFISKVVVGPPAVFLNPAKTFPTAWCVINQEFSSVRLRKLATVDNASGVSPWDKFVEANRAQFGPRDGGKKWQTDLCPLPPVALPMILLHGYGLPAA